MRPINQDIADYIWEHRAEPTSVLTERLGLGATTIKRYRKRHLFIDGDRAKRRREIEQYLSEHYSDTPDRQIERTLRCGHGTVMRYAKRMGLAKSPQYFERIRLTNRANIRIAIASYHNRGEVRRKLWQMERRREELGLPRKTKLRLAAISPKRSKAFHYMRRKYGYICSKEEPFVAYYDASTRRSEAMERHYTKKLSLEFKRYGQEKDNAPRADAETLYAPVGAMGNG